RGLPGTSLQESLAMGANMHKRLLEDKAVRHVTQLAGRAELGEDTWGVEYSEMELSIKPDNAEDIREVRNRIKKIAEETPGVSTEVFAFLSERIKELLPGTPAALAVQVQGESLKDLEETARQIETTLNGIKGRDNVRVEPQTGAAEMVVHI